MNLIQRAVNAEVFKELITAGVPPFLARLYAARGVLSANELDVSLNKLIPPEQLTYNKDMAKLLADAIADKKSILIVGDYDADGATATAVAVKGLTSMGGIVDFLVPNRFEYGYGLTPEIVQLASTSKPDIIITVDNGIASVDGVAVANKLGIEVLITDHHLPGERKPEAACIVNPNQKDCNFKSKNLAGVGVMFYVLLGLRAELRERGAFSQKTEPNLVELLDLVALGTVSDLVKLDANNRILVEQGLRRIRAGFCCEGIKALLRVSGRDFKQANAQDLGFYIGPRLNAAGRLEDIKLGIQCLLADDLHEAQKIAKRLHELNALRRNIEADMQEGALVNLDNMQVENQFSISLFEPSWPQGVVGILASRIKEKFHRPVIAFADAGEDILKGSGRSIAGLHLRDVLDLVTKRNPDLILKFGGHAMAAGLSIKKEDLLLFQKVFESVVRDLISPADLMATVETDGSLETSEMNLEVANMLTLSVWGQGVASPLFSDLFTVLNQRIVGEKHLKLNLEKDEERFDAIFFGQSDFLPDQFRGLYQLQVNAYNGVKSLQLQIVSALPA